MRNQQTQFCLKTVVKTNKRQW